ncbi:MAG: ATPase [Actinobacteria bacterium]|nr:ATPase [Actinomycetota bacterium]
MKECPRCGAVHDGHRWIPEPDQEVYSKLKEKKAEKSNCPGCLRVERGQVEGVVTLKGAFLTDHLDEIKNVISRVEKNRHSRNVTSQILRSSEENGEMVIETCDGHLAERIGKEIHKAFKGNVDMKWQEKDTFVRVLWQRD